jgi:hypothetical protein
MIRIEVGSSIPYLVWNLDHPSPSISSITLREWSRFVFNGRSISFFHCKNARCFIILPFLIRLIRWVSLTVREFFILKVSANYKQYYHHILCLGGSSIPDLESDSHALFLSIGLISGRIGWNYSQKLPFHCIGAR